MTAPDSSEIRSKVFGGVTWDVAQRWVVRLGSLATVALLTRTLTPQDFGTVSVAMTFAPFVYLLSDLGFGSYLTQAKEVDSRMTSTAFWFSSVVGAVLVLGFVAGGPLVAASYHLPKAAEVMYGLAPSVLFVTLSSVPIALLRRRMEFRKVALQSLVGGLAGQVAAVVLALTGFGVWALVAQIVAYQLAILVMAWRSARWHPTLEFSLVEFRSMLRFGVNVVSADGLAVLRQWAETTIIAAVLGVTAVGYLNIATRLITVTQDLSASAIVPISTVVFAKVRESTERLRGSYLRAQALSYAVVMPIMIVVTLGAPLIIAVLFGPGWERSVFPAQALAIAGILTLGANLDNGLFVGVGKPGAWLGYALAIDALTVATTAALVRYGLAGTSVGFIAVAFLATCVRWVLVGRLIGARPREASSSFFRAAVAAAVSAGGGFLVLHVSGQLADIPRLILIGCAVLLCHLVVVRFVLPEAFAELLAALRSRLRRRASPGEPDALLSRGRPLLGGLRLK